MIGSMIMKKVFIIKPHVLKFLTNMELLLGNDSHRKYLFPIMFLSPFGMKAF